MLTSKKNKIMKNIAILLLLFTCLVGCTDDDLVVNPHDKLGSAEVITSEDDLRNAVNAVYDVMTSTSYYGNFYLTAGDMLGDDAITPKFSSSGSVSPYFKYDWTKTYSTTSVYENAYYAIAHINDVLVRAESLEETESKIALISEIKALRALLHFDVAKLYGPLPINLGKGNIEIDALCVPKMDQLKSQTDYKGMLRVSVSEIYKFITEELETALPHMPTGKISGTLGQDGVKAALSRIYLYMGKYDLAYKYADQLISDPTKYSIISRDSYIDSWGQPFASESIFELVINEADGKSYSSIGWSVMANDLGGRVMSSSKNFEDLMEQDANDIRRDWFELYSDPNRGSGYLPSNKYPGIGSVYFNNIKVFRASEMYFIAAECLLKSTTNMDKAKAANRLNMVRDNRTTTEPSKFNASNITIEDILHERRLELFAEGHRAFDLWRNQMPVRRWSSLEEKELGYTSDQSDGVIEFDDYKRLVPISESQLELLPVEYQEAQQNPGY